MADSSKTELWLFRHGQTDWNRERKYQGCSDIPLNEVGHQQAQQAAEWLAQQPLKFDAVYCSSLTRARQTAGAIAACLHVPLYPRQALSEINQGEWEGLPAQWVIEQFRGAPDPSQLRAPGGETVAETAERVWQGVNTIASEHPGGRVILVMHALVISTIFCGVEGRPLAQVYDKMPAHATPYHMLWPPLAQGGVIRAIQMNG